MLDPHIAAQLTRVRRSTAVAIAPPPSPSRPDPVVVEPPPTDPPAAPAATTVPTGPGRSPSTAVLRCSGLRKRFGARQAVDGVGFSIAPGETYGLLGPNGAGKTTTISMICGILRRDEGEVLVAGRPMEPGTTALKAEIGYVPQDLAIYPDLSARENLSFFGRLYGLGGATSARASTRSSRSST